VDTRTPTGNNSGNHNDNDNDQIEAKRSDGDGTNNSILEDRKRIPKTNAYYHEEGTHRRYYYTIDTRGHLFLESAKVRVFATAFRDKKFLNFFFRKLEPNKYKDLHPDIPYMSLCGKEINFVTPDDPLSSLVFTSLDEDGHLRYGDGTMTERFDPLKLYWSTRTYRMYHAVDEHPKLIKEMGLLHPVLADRIAENIVWGGVEDNNKNVIKWNGKEHHLQLLEEIS
jgi:hypothetical protein